MMKKAAVLAVLLVPAFASAQAQTQSADTLVVVTPSAPTVVVTGGSAAPVAAPGAVVAQPVAAPVAPPQNEDWSNVSHINGQIVPVGERGAYLYKFKKTNIAVDPIGPMFGFYGVSVQHAISQNVTVRADVSAWSVDSESGLELRGSFPIYLKRAYSGPFIEPGIVIHNDSRDEYDYAYDCIDCTSSSSHGWVGPEMMLGYSYSFDSGLTMAMAAGAARPINKDTMDEYSSDDPEFVGYFRVGYSF